MNKQRAVFKMLWPDKCWHEYGILYVHGQSHIASFNKNEIPEEHMDELEAYKACIHCCKRIEIASIEDLTTWRGFGMMWERAQECEWWEKFIEHMYIVKALAGKEEKIVHPTRFMEALYDFGVAHGIMKRVRGENE